MRDRGVTLATTIEAKLAERGLTLPVSPAPSANYVRYMRTGNLIYLAGHGPHMEGGAVYVGKLGAEFTIEEGQAAAQATALNLLATLKAAIGDLDKVVQFVKVLGMVNCTPDFPDPPLVINGFSDLIVELYGERGRHARSAVGMGSLPGHMPVEIEAIVEVEPA